MEGLGPGQSIRRLDAEKGFGVEGPGILNDSGRCCSEFGAASAAVQDMEWSQRIRLDGVQPWFLFCTHVADILELTAGPTRFRMFRPRATTVLMKALALA